MLPDRFWEKVHIESDNPDSCWTWKAGVGKQGYGRFGFGGKAFLTHRLAFLDLGGILTDEKPCVLHKCNNRPCCNPLHLYAGDKADNMRDCLQAGTHRAPLCESHAKKTHCNRGHPLSGDNLAASHLRRGGRVCRTCLNAWDKERNKRRRAKT